MNAKLLIDINGHQIASSQIHRIDPGVRQGGVPDQRFDISLDACPHFRSDNELGLT